MDATVLTDGYQMITADELFPDRRKVRLADFVSHSSAIQAQDVQIAGGRRDPVPFARWQWKDLPLPGRAARGMTEWWRIRRMSRALAAGAILVLIGHSGSGKSRLMSQIAVNGALMLDDTRHLGRDRVLSAVSSFHKTHLGCVMAFQCAHDFRSMDLAAHLAQHRVMFFLLQGGNDRGVNDRRQF